MNLITIAVDSIIIVSIALYLTFDYVRYVVTIQHCVFEDYQCKICKDENMVCDRRKKVRF